MMFFCAAAGFFTVFISVLLWVRHWKEPSVCKNGLQCRRRCSDVTDMLWRLINCRFIIIHWLSLQKKFKVGFTVILAHAEELRNNCFPSHALGWQVWTGCISILATSGALLMLA